jgi:hypothetical protein
VYRKRGFNLHSTHTTHCTHCTHCTHYIGYLAVPNVHIVRSAVQNRAAEVCNVSARRHALGVEIIAPGGWV